MVVYNLFALMATTTPSWITSAEAWAGYVGGLLTALAKMPSASGTTPSAGSGGIALGLSIDPLPEVSIGMSLLDDAIKLGTVLQVDENTPAMIAAKAGQLHQNKLDSINEALANQDLDALRRLSSL
jgi:hypothetical protein